MADTKITIRMTDRPPVTIDKTLWERLAYAKTHDGKEFESRANQWSWICVRRHADGRTIVYGVHDGNWQGQTAEYAGELLPPGEDVIPAIHRVAEAIIYGGERLAQRVINELPAVDLDDPNVMDRSIEVRS